MVYYVVIDTVGFNIAATGQYLVSERSIARLTSFSFILGPLKVNSKWEMSQI